MKNIYKIIISLFISLTIGGAFSFAEEKKMNEDARLKKLESLFENVDTDKSSTVSLEEFLGHKREHPGKGKPKCDKKEKAKAEGENDNADEEGKNDNADEEGKGRSKERAKRKSKGKEMDMDKRMEIIKKRKTEAFEKSDKNKDGSLDKDEFFTMIKSFHKNRMEHMQKRKGSKRQENHENKES